MVLYVVRHGQTEWNAIEKGESWCESILAEVVICQDGNVSIN